LLMGCFASVSLIGRPTRLLRNHIITYYRRYIPTLYIIPEVVSKVPGQNLINLAANPAHYANARLYYILPFIYKYEISWYVFKRFPVYRTAASLRPHTPRWRRHNYPSTVRHGLRADFLIVMYRIWRHAI